MSIDLSQLQTLSPEEKALLYQSVLLRKARTHFPTFLRYVISQDEDGKEVPAPIGPLPGDPLAGWMAERGLERQNWPHVLELAELWDRGESTILLKARQMWFTWELAAFAVFKGHLGPNVLAISQGQDYSDQMVERARFIYERLPPELKLSLAKDNTSEMHFKGAGRIKSLPSTRDAGRSLTAGLTIADEGAFHKFAAENFRAYEPASKQIIICSTANGPHGWFHSQVMSAIAGNSAFRFIFYPWHARKDRDMAWYKERERRYEGFLADFRREFPSTVEEAFTSLSGLVYKDFNPEVHVATPRVRYEDCRLAVAGVDFGGSPGNPNAVVILGLTRDDHIIQFAEFAEPGELSLAPIGGFLSQWHKRKPFYSVECDWVQVAIQTLRSQFRVPARKGNKARLEGLEQTEWLLQNNRLTIDPTCTRSIDEFYGYRWRESLDPNTKERYQTSTPVDHHADLMDARRYALMTLLQFLRKGDTIQNIGGGKIATKAV